MVNGGGLFNAFNQCALCVAYSAENEIVVESNIVRRFQLLIKAVEDNWPHTPEEERSPVTMAYYDFLQISPFKGLEDAN